MSARNVKPKTDQVEGLVSDGLSPAMAAVIMGSMNSMAHTGYLFDPSRSEAHIRKYVQGIIRVGRIVEDELSK